MVQKISTEVLKQSTIDDASLTKLADKMVEVGSALGRSLRIPDDEVPEAVEDVVGEYLSVLDIMNLASIIVENSCHMTLDEQRILEAGTVFGAMSMIALAEAARS